MAKSKEPKFYSQFGEDKKIYKFFLERKSGLCIEVGGGNGISSSNTFFFDQIGWKSIIIEPVPYLYDKIKTSRPNSIVLNFAASNTTGGKTFYIVKNAEALSSLCIDKDSMERVRQEKGIIKEITVQTDTLDNLLKPYLEQQPIDFVSIDVEGAEVDVLRGFNLFKWQPRLVIIEDNNQLTDHTIENYMGSFGYLRFKRTGVNDWYIHHEDELLPNKLKLFFINSCWISLVKLKIILRIKLKEYIPRPLLQILRYFR